MEPHICGNTDTDENPAVTWNTVGAPQAGRGAPLCPVLTKVGISFILAPPILTAGVLVSGLYFEVSINVFVNIISLIMIITVLLHILLNMNFNIYPVVHLIFS